MSTDTKRDEGGPAFPTNQERGQHGDVVEWGRPGMSLRDYFAAHALKGEMAGNWRDNHYKPLDGLTTIENVARAAYEFADAMLKARSQ